MVIWITGLSGAGKTTVCEAIYRLVKPSLPQLVLLDGDVIRTVMGHDLGYEERHRFIQIGRIQNLAKALSDQGLVVLVAALYAHPDLLAWNRANIDGYVEVLIDAPLDLVMRRDPKGLYAKVAAGTMPDVVGVDIPWHRPDNADIVVDATRPAEPEETARRLIAAIPLLAGVAKTLETA